MTEPTDLRELREWMWEFSVEILRGVHGDGDPCRPSMEDADTVREAVAALERLEELEAALRSGAASDGYHTHRELYEYRMLYNAHAARGWLAAGIPVVKSWKHSDGEPCFGGGWFAVVATLPTGQVSNHYAAEHWHLFDVPEVDLPPEYDGHTPADAAERLRAALATVAPAPQQVEPDAPQMNSRAREWVDRAHRACMDPTRPRQSIGEMLAALLLSTPAPAPQQGGPE